MQAIINLTKWPTGLGLDLEDFGGGGSRCLAGKHGGGIGTTVSRFYVDTKELKKILDEYEAKAVE